MALKIATNSTPQSIKNKIITLINEAENSISIANSWLTDLDVISALYHKSSSTEIKIILSRDILNAYRYSDIKYLIKRNVDVRIMGSESPGLNNFMHAKFLIIDGKRVFGGSYNLTSNADSNYECFFRYHDSEILEITYLFNEMYMQSEPYEFDIEYIKIQINRKDVNQNEFNKKLIDSFEYQRSLITANSKKYTILDFNYKPDEACYKNSKGYKLSRIQAISCHYCHAMNLKYVIYPPKEGSEWCNADGFFTWEEYEKARKEYNKLHD